MSGNSEMLEIEVLWTGPFCLSKYEAATGLQPPPKSAGVYLFAVEKSDKEYILFCPGRTGSFRRRMREHRIDILRGKWNILDMDALREGVRKVIRSGWTNAPSRSPEKTAEWNGKKVFYETAAREQLKAFRIFVAELGPDDKRIHARLESEIYFYSISKENAYSELPDKGLSLSRRWDDEMEIRVFNCCNHKIHGLPDEIVI